MVGGIRGQPRDPPAHEPPERPRVVEPHPRGGVPQLAGAPPAPRAGARCARRAPPTRRPAAPRPSRAPTVSSGLGAWGSSSTSARRTGSTGSSRSATTAGSTRCSGRPRCARRRSTRRALDDPRPGDARRRRRHRLHHRGHRRAGRRRARDDARPEPAPARARARASRRSSASASCSATRSGCRSRTRRSTATCRRGASSTGPTRSAGSPRRTACCAPGGVGRRDRPRQARQPDPAVASETWMLFPPEAEYRAWFERAGFEDVRVDVLAPDWYRGRSPYGVAIAAPSAGPAAPAPRRCPRPRGPPAPLTLAGRARFAARFVLGSAAGFAFVPIGAALALRARLARRRDDGGRPPSPSPPAPRGVLWRFSRPHTAIGTTVSVVGLFAIVVGRARRPSTPGRAAFHLFWTLVAGARRERVHRRHQPDHRRRDRPRQQARSCRSRRAS